MAQMALHSSPHVILLSCPAAGHYIPILQAAKQLIANGITISYVSIDQHVTEVQEDTAVGQELIALGMRLVKLGDGMSISATDFVKAYKNPKMEEKLTGLLEAVIVDLSTSAHIDAPCCILADLFPTWAQDVAYKFRIPRHVIYTCAAVALAIGLQVERLAAEGYMPVTSLNQSKLITFIPGVPALKPTDLPPTFTQLDEYKDAMKLEKRINEALVVLVNTAEELEGTVLDALKTQVIGTEKVKTQAILAIGPLQAESEVLNPEAPNHIIQKPSEERDPCVRWLNTQAPSSVLFISFGSFNTISAPQILELAQGLEASNQPFLWILRSPNPASASPTLISITEFLPSGFEERTKERGLCFSGWAPQLRILSHAATGAFLTHCGWNSVLEGLRAGIPLLTWPLKADQMLSARVVLNRKVAIEMRKRPDGLVDKAEVERTVRLLMQEDEGKAVTVRQNVMELKIGLRKAVAEGGPREEIWKYMSNILGH